MHTVPAREELRGSRFGTASCRNALAGARKVHIGYRIRQYRNHLPRTSQRPTHPRLSVVGSRLWPSVTGLLPAFGDRTAHGCGFRTQLPAERRLRLTASSPAICSSRSSPTTRLANGSAPGSSRRMVDAAGHPLLLSASGCRLLLSASGSCCRLPACYRLSVTGLLTASAFGRGSRRCAGFGRRPCGRPRLSARLSASGGRMRVVHLNDSHAAHPEIERGGGWSASIPASGASRCDGMVAVVAER